MPEFWCVILQGSHEFVLVATRLVSECVPTSAEEEEGMTGVATRTLQAVRDLVPVITTRGVEIEAARRIPPARKRLQFANLS